MSSVGSFFSYLNDARSHEPEILLYISTLQCTGHQMISVAGFGRSVNHVHHLTSSYVLSVFLNFSLAGLDLGGGDRVAAQRPPTRRVNQCLEITYTIVAPRHRPQYSNNSESRTPFKFFLVCFYCQSRNKNSASTLNLRS